MKDDDGATGCVSILLVLAVNLLAGGWSVNYLLDFFLEKTIPFVAATGIGLVVGEVSIPVAIIVVILRWAGVL